MTEIDMSIFTVAKSDQLNADDLLGGPKTIKITKVTAQEDSKEQPVSFHYEGDNGRPFKPCLTMRRLIMGAWGKYAAQYVGRSMTLYRDPTVAFGGMQVGGIRISHMSDIDSEKTIALQVTRGRKAPFKIKPLKQEPQRAEPEGDAFGLPPANQDKAAEWVEWYLGELKICENTDALITLQADAAKTLAKLEKERRELHELCVNAGSQRAGELQSEGAEA